MSWTTLRITFGREFERLKAGLMTAFYMFSVLLSFVLISKLYSSSSNVLLTTIYYRMDCFGHLECLEVHF